MKIYSNIKTYMVAGAMLLSMGSLTSCLGDLDQEPILEKGQSAIHNEEDCMSFLAKIYSGFGLSGNVGPSGGVQDLQGSDQGSLVFLRGLLSLQLYPTDEALWNWKDEGIYELCSTTWDYTLFYSYTFYQRAMLNIRYCKEFLDNYPEDSDIADIKQLRDEVRALRAMNYYYLIDIYRNPGWVWDDSPTADKSWKPSQLGTKEIFNRIVAELEDLSANSALPQRSSAATYGRMTKPVVNTVLAKMYLNAEAYIGTAMYDKALTYVNKVIGEGGFGLEENYRNLFCGENHLTAEKKNEIIFAISCDAENAKSYGNSIMVTAAAYGGGMNPKWFGMDASWTCLKPCSQLIKLFDSAPVSGYDKHGSTLRKDSRYAFYDVKTYVDPSLSDNCTEANVQDRRNVVPTLGDWNTGYLCYKFTNLGWNQQEVTPAAFPNTDFPLFRLADIYLMYAECAARNAAGSDKSKAVDYVNQLRQRAYGDTSANITAADLTLDFVLDERARELYWEGQRRSDLVRFGKFTKEYAWDYKGGVQEGVATIDSKYNVYPISDRDLTANLNLDQNEGYEKLK